MGPTLPWTESLFVSDEVLSASPLIVLLAGSLLALLVLTPTNLLAQIFQTLPLYSFTSLFQHTVASILGFYFSSNESASFNLAMNPLLNDIVRVIYTLLSSFLSLVIQYFTASKTESSYFKSNTDPSESKDTGDWYCTESDVDFFKSRLDERAGCWKKICTKSLDEHLKYDAYYRNLPNNKTEYKSVMIVRDATAEEMSDFYLDDKSRSLWDPMLTKTEIIEYGQFAERCLVVRWIRSFPFPFLTDREYIISRRSFRRPRTIYTVTKAITHPSAPISRLLVRMEHFYSMWSCKDVECPWGSDRGACEVILLHHEQFKIPEKLARFAANKGMWSFVKSMGPGLRTFIEQRRTHCRKTQPDARAFGYVPQCPSISISESSTDMESEGQDLSKKKKITKTIRRAIVASVVGTLVFLIKQKN